MNPSLAYFFAEIMQQCCRLFGRPQQAPDTEIVRMVRLDMATLVGTLCSRDDNIKDDDYTRQAILEVAAGCFKMLEIIGDHPVDRLARELDVDRQYADDIAVLAAYRREHPEKQVLFLQGIDDRARLAASRRAFRTMLEEAGLLELFDAVEPVGGR